MPPLPDTATRLAPGDPPALDRLRRLDLTPPITRPRPSLGYQPGLDGLRALSVVAVICYHAGFGWMRGGWVGVEVFFVVSGFLITSLLIDEQGRTGSVGLRQFWLRRARRLLPALAVVLAAVAVAVLVVGTVAQRADVRRDTPWALLYLGNWGQIVGGVPYYGGDPSPLRHLWSLAIEEQFYLLWPLIFVALARTGWRAATTAKVVAALGVAAMAATAWWHRGMPAPIAAFGGVDRVNFLYLSTFTRAGGLLLGAAAAFVWRPWRRPGRTGVRAGAILDAAGGTALAGLGVIAVLATLTAAYVYQWLLALVSILALVAVLAAVHPAGRRLRAILSGAPLVAVGRRSYGLYLWHWPVFVLVGATDGAVAPFVAGVGITVVVTELSYRFVETPARRGALERWWRTRGGDHRRRILLGAGLAVVVLAGCYATVTPYDRAVGGADAAFAAPVVTAAPAPPAVGNATPVTNVVPVAPVLPVRVAVVGDSQAHSLARNTPTGLGSTFAIADGSVDGCSVYDEGRVHSRLASFRSYFEMCEGWQGEWASVVTRHRASVALVVLGAWDVFDLETATGSVLAFGTPPWDAYVRDRLQSGIDALARAGAHVALLEVPCMRPVAVEGQGVPPLPERGDDARVAHVNGLFRAVAAANPTTVTFVQGPAAWCTDPAVATDLGHRWDGVHVYKPGAKLIFDTIAPALLAL